jgi:hypothetical protein
VATRPPDAPSRAVLRAEAAKARTVGEMVEVLRQAGLTRRLAKRRVEQYGLERVRAVIRILPDARRQRDKADNPAGFVLAALSRGYDLSAARGEQGQGGKGLGRRAETRRPSPAE